MKVVILDAPLYAYLNNYSSKLNGVQCYCYISFTILHYLSQHANIADSQDMISNLLCVRYTKLLCEHFNPIRHMGGRLIFKIYKSINEIFLYSILSAL